MGLASRAKAAASITTRHPDSMALIVNSRQRRVDAAERQHADVTDPWWRILLPMSNRLPIAGIRHSFTGSLCPIAWVARGARCHTARGDSQ